MKLIKKIINNSHMGFVVALIVVTPVYFNIIQPLLASIHPIFAFQPPMNYSRYPNSVSNLIYLALIVIVYFIYNLKFVDYE